MSSEFKVITVLTSLVLLFFIAVVVISGVPGLLFVVEVMSGLIVFFIVVAIVEYVRLSKKK